MSVSTMEKLTAIVRREDTEQLLAHLMRMRAVSLIDAPQDEPYTHSLAEEADVLAAAALAARVDAVLPVLAKRSRRKTAIFRQQIKVIPSEFRSDGRYELAMKVVEQTERILARQQELRSAREAACARMQSYLPYLDWARPLNFGGTPSTVAWLGCVPAGTSPDVLLGALEGQAAVVRLVCDDRTGLYIFVMAHRAEAEQVRHALSGVGFLPASFPDDTGTAKELFDRADRERAQIDDTLARLEQRLCSLAGRIDEVEILSDLAHTAELAEGNKARLVGTGRCTVIRAWCPTQHKARVSRLLTRMDAAFEYTPPEEGDEPPILLKNNAFARNFEWVLGMYAYPAYGKFDPTFIMSIFYCFIFGLMFADAGYGLVISAVCFAAVRFLKPREGMKRFLLMFAYCGLFCILFGVLFGSYFGNFPLAFLEYVVGRSPEEMPNLALLPSTAANVAVLFDPLQNPMAFLVVSLAAGGVHLIAGMAVQAYLLCRRGKVLDALFDIGSYWLLFAGIGVLFLHKLAGILLLSSGVLAILLTQGRAKKGVAGKIIGGFGGLYGLINYASDLLSYSRILALGLATAVIAQVVNVLATLKGGSFIGILMMIVIFCIGHVLNLVINVLGTFVHTARLQYIEFFGKFYEDGGVPFRPVAAADRYSADVTPEEQV